MEDMILLHQYDTITNIYSPITCLTVTNDNIFIIIGEIHECTFAIDHF